MAPLPTGFSYGQWSLVYNALSFGIAAMGSATIFFWLQLPNLAKGYRTALVITGLVTAIATYHNVRIFNSWVDAFSVVQLNGAGDYVVSLTGAPFNDAYRYVDWLLTVPLLLIELILVMKLPRGETVSRVLSWWRWVTPVRSSRTWACAGSGGAAPWCPFSLWWGVCW